MDLEEDDVRRGVRGDAMLSLALRRSLCFVVALSLVVCRHLTFATTTTLFSVLFVCSPTFLLLLAEKECVSRLANHAHQSCATSAKSSHSLKRITTSGIDRIERVGSVRCHLSIDSVLWYMQNPWLAHSLAAPVISNYTIAITPYMTWLHC